MELIDPHHFFPNHFNILRLFLKSESTWNEKNPKMFTDFPFMARLVHPACPEGCTEVLASVSDPMMDFYLSYFTKTWILELSKDLFHNSTQLGSADHPIVQSVRVNHPTGRVNRPDHVLILTPSTSTTRMNLDTRRSHFDQYSSISPTLTPFIIF